MDLEKLDAVATSLPGSATADKQTVVEAVVKHQDSVRAEDGLSALGMAGLSESSRRRYYSTAATGPGAKTVEVAFSKTESRRIAEHSQMSAVSLAVGMAVSNYRLVGPGEKLQWENKEDDELLNLISTANGGARVSYPPPSVPRPPPLTSRGCPPPT